MCRNEAVRERRLDARVTERRGNRIQVEEGDEYHADDLRIPCEARCRRRKQIVTGWATRPTAFSRGAQNASIAAPRRPVPAHQHLEAVRAQGVAAVPDEYARPFDQNLAFLVPRWPVVEDHPYGRSPWLPRGPVFTMFGTDSRRHQWVEGLRGARGARSPASLR